MQARIFRAQDGIDQPDWEKALVSLYEEGWRLAHEIRPGTWVMERWTFERYARAHQDAALGMKVPIGGKGSA